MNLKNIPTNPGCYLYKNKKGVVIYVGKAKNLSKRVKSYFNKKDLDEKTTQLVEHIADVEFFITDNEVEALILENNLIKKYYPKYNINLKDAKRYAYVKLTNEVFPRIMLARKKDSKEKYFGPFVSAEIREQLLKFVNKTFKLRTCKRLPKKVCLRYHIGLCTAPCVNAVNSNKYNIQIKKAEMVLLGKSSDLIQSLKKELTEVVKQQNFEKGIILRNELSAIEWMNEKQKTERGKTYDEDIINYIIHKDKVYLILFNVKHGILLSKEEFEFLDSPNFLEDFVLSYYSDNIIPKEIILPKQLSSALKEFLELSAKKKVNIVVPKKGEKKELLKLVEKNVRISFFGEQEKVEDLKKKLKMQNLPRVIECFDVSHLSGTATVASMVQFRHGKADKNNYRRFKIRSVEGIDDPACIAEVVSRRYSRLFKEKKDMPDLVLIDGGKGQLSAALSALEKINVKLPVISIAKKFEEIFTPGLRFSLKLDKKSKALKYLQEIRDEAHRFAIAYNRLLRKKKIRE